METNLKVTVVLKLSKRSPDFIHQARAVAAGLTGNPDFPSPNPPVATLDAQIDALDLAQTAVLARTRGTAQARNAAKAVVVTSLKLACAYVQSVADANLDRGDAIARSAGMNVKARAVRIKPVLAVRMGAVPGFVILTAKSVGRVASYEWEMSADQGHTWTALPNTFAAKTMVAGLNSAQAYAFRQRSHTKAGASDWSPVVTLVVT
jgi:hypothetical protein